MDDQRTYKQSKRQQLLLTSRDVKPCHHTAYTLPKQIVSFWNVDEWEAILDDKLSMSMEDRQAVDIWENTIE